MVANTPIDATTIAATAIILDFDISIDGRFSEIVYNGFHTQPRVGFRNVCVSDLNIKFDRHVIYIFFISIRSSS